MYCSFNQAKPKTDVEARVYEVLSHKNWGSSSSLMHEVARDTFEMERFHVVTRLMWEGMENQRPAAWRIVFKALTLLEFLIKNGAERCIDDARNHGHVLRSMGQFNYYEGTIDRGLGVREKTKQILEILGDDERIREERQKARTLREKFGTGASTSSGGGGGGGGGGAQGGYGNQDWSASGKNDNQDWSGGGGGGGKSSGGYGDGGIDSSKSASPYDNGGGYSGRYGGASGGGVSAASPTFAAMPEDSKKKKSKKKKKQPVEPVAAPAPGMCVCG
jgi:epsin